MSCLKIENLHVSIDDKEILKGIDLEVNSGEVHALMGPNGNGKSTLLQTIMGHPRYVVTAGSITFDGKDVLAMEVDSRSKAGLFLGMQYPQEIPGVNNSDFMKAAINARRETPISLFEFIKKMEKSITDLQLKPEIAHRYLNEGFSGGEKKRNEIVQMLLLEPKIAMLDEIDSGLDVDALKIVATSINEKLLNSDLGLLVVSHYERFYQLLVPTYAHVLIDGKIVISGDNKLVTRIDTDGYDWLYEQLKIETPTENNRPISIGVCAVKKEG